MFQDNYLIVVPVYVSWDILMHEKLLYLWFNDVIDTVKVEIKEDQDQLKNDYKFLILSVDFIHRLKETEIFNTNRLVNFQLFDENKFQY